MGTKNNPGKFDCYAKAHPDEPMFTLLGRDPVAPVLVRMWITLRSRTADGEREREKLQEAHEVCRALEAWCRSIGREPISPGGIRLLQQDEELQRLRTFARACANQSNESGTRIAALYALSGDLGDIVKGMRGDL